MLMLCDLLGKLSWSYLEKKQKKKQQHKTVWKEGGGV